MKGTVIVVGAAFAVGLAVVIGTRMSADAMAMVVGVACGMLASLPTSLLLVWALGRRGQANAAQVETQPRYGLGAGYPPVVVVNPGSGYGMHGYGLPALGPLERGLPAPGGARSFRVVGQDETLVDYAQPLFPGLAEE
jgi:hypothetical protein